MNCELCGQQIVAKEAAGAEGESRVEVVRVTGVMINGVLLNEAQAIAVRNALTTMRVMMEDGGANPRELVSLYEVEEILRLDAWGRHVAGCS